MPDMMKSRLPGGHGFVAETRYQEVSVMFYSHLVPDKHIVDWLNRHVTVLVPVRKNRV